MHPAPTARRRSCWSARPTGRARSGRCTRASPAHRGGLRSLEGRLARARNRWTGPPSSARSAGCWSATRGPRRAIAIRLVDDPTLPAGCASTGRSVPSGRTGRAVAKAATCCAPTSATGRRGPVADLHPAHRGRGRLPHPQERAVDPADLASARRPRARPHPRLLPRLRAVEDARAVAKPGRPRQQPAHHPRGARRHPQRRRRPAHRETPPRELRFAASSDPTMPRRPPRSPRLRFRANAPYTPKCGITSRPSSSTVRMASAGAMSPKTMSQMK